MLSDVCLSVAYIGHKSRTEIGLSVLDLCPMYATERQTSDSIGTEVAHVTRDSDTTFKVKRLKVKVTRPLYSPRRRR